MPKYLSYSPNSVGQQLCRAAGIDPVDVISLDFHSRVGEAEWASVEYYVHGEIKVDRLIVDQSVRIRSLPIEQRPLMLRVSPRPWNR